MAERIYPPFSARIRGAHSQVDNDCPQTTRMGLLHVLHQLIERKYVDSWKVIVAELQRLARVSPFYDEDGPTQQVQGLLLELPWDKDFDFCERLHGYLAQDAWYETWERTQQ